MWAWNICWCQKAEYYSKVQGVVTKVRIKGLPLTKCWQLSIQGWIQTLTKKWLKPKRHEFIRIHEKRYQAPLSMGFSKQEYWSGLPFPSPGNLLSPGLLHFRQTFYCLCHQGSPRKSEVKKRRRQLFWVGGNDRSKIKLKYSPKDLDELIEGRLTNVTIRSRECLPWRVKPRRSGDKKPPSEAVTTMENQSAPGCHHSGNLGTETWLLPTPVFSSVKWEWMGHCVRGHRWNELTCAGTSQGTDSIDGGLIGITDQHQRLRTEI